MCPVGVDRTSRLPRRAPSHGLSDQRFAALGQAMTLMRCRAELKYPRTPGDIERRHGIVARYFAAKLASSRSPNEHAKNSSLVVSSVRDLVASSPYNPSEA